MMADADTTVPACVLVFPCLAYASNLKDGGSTFLQHVGISIQRGQFCKVKKRYAVLMSEIC
jgi:hypothetical protein